MIKKDYGDNDGRIRFPPELHSHKKKIGYINTRDEELDQIQINN